MHKKTHFKAAHEYALNGRYNNSLCDKHNEIERMVEDANFNIQSKILKLGNKLPV